MRCRETGVGLTLVLLGGLALTGAAPRPALADDDWDWGAVEAMDDAPVTRPASPSAAAEAPKDDKPASTQPRAAENAVPDFVAPPTPALAMFADMPPFEVVQSKRDEEMHPCANCHQWVTSNPEPRKLQTPHDNFELQHGLHGQGKFWCFTCHDDKANFSLKTLEGEPVAFTDAYVVCSQCHVDQARDWAHGAHGKRVGSWQGERKVLNCTACHYQHRPGIKPREPMPGPKMRIGLPRPSHWVAASERSRHDDEHATPWEREADRRRESGEHDYTPGAAASEPMAEPDAES